MAPDSRTPHELTHHESRGFCPVCGAEVDWIATARLWPSRRAAQAVLPSHSGTCPRCHRVLMFAVVHDPAEKTGGTPA